MNGINNVLGNTFETTATTIANFLPRFISGLIVLILGIILASFLKQIILQLFKFIKLESLLRKYGVPESREGLNWSNILAELIRWFVIILFLVPTAEVWGLGQFVEVLNGLLAFLPNVIIAVLLILVGFVIARLVHDVLRASLHGLSAETARNIARAGKWAVLVFVFLVVLNQLGIASDLIRILFAGVVAMIALAGGLAFGLGGRDSATELLEKIKKNW